MVDTSEADVRHMLRRIILPELVGLVPSGMMVPYYLEAAAQQLGASVYFYANGVDVLCSVVAFALSATIGDLSQPQNYGRKAVLVYLAVADTIPIAVLHITQNYKLFLLVRFLCCFIGGQLPNMAAVSVINSWVTDWATEQQKVRVNSQIMAGLFSAFALAPIVGVMLTALGVPLEVMLLGTLGVKILHPVALYLWFPDAEETAVVARRNREISDSSPCLRTTLENAPANVISARRLVNAWRYLAYRHPLALIVTLVDSAVGKGFQKNLPFYLASECGASRTSLGMFLSVSSFGALVLQGVVVPWHSRLPRASPQFWIVMGNLTQLVHLVVAVVSSSLGPMMAVCWLPAFTAAADPVLTSTVSRCSPEGAPKDKDQDDVSTDQGLILGALTGLKTLSSILGPLIMAFALQSGLSASASFAVLTVCMLPALVAACLLYREDRLSKQEWVQEYDAVVGAKQA